MSKWLGTEKLTICEIATAGYHRVMYVDSNGYGYVPKDWYDWLLDMRSTTPPPGRIQEWRNMVRNRAEEESHAACRSA